MAIKVKPLAQSKVKWRTNAQNAQQEYTTNAEAAGPDWLTKTIAAEDIYKQAITAPGVSRRFAAGVRKAGADKYTKRIVALGGTRFAQGVAEAEDDWEKGFSPYAAALSALTLSARRPRGDPQNIRRVEEVARKLNAVRLAALGGAS